MEFERVQETDGNWIAEIPDMPGTLVHAGSREEAVHRVEALALRVIADRLEHGEQLPELKGVFAVTA